MATEWEQMSAKLRQTKITAAMLINELKKLPPNTRILLSSDEEMNSLFAKFEVSDLSDMPSTAVLWGYSGSEVE